MEVEKPILKNQQEPKKQANYVFILDDDKTSLGMIHPGYARHLLNNKFAAVFRMYPFTIILKYHAGFQPKEYQVKIDPGSKETGFAILLDNQVLFAMVLAHRGSAISKKLSDRKSQRRRRRSRKTRYRRCKFNNKKNRKGEKHSKKSKKDKLQPSILHRSLTIETWVKRFAKFCPITNAAIELVKFDTQKMNDENISGVEYQQGTLAGYEVREYVLERDNRHCVYCNAEGSDKVKLQLDHINPRSKGGSDRVSNLVLSCEKCNLAKSNKPVEQFLSERFKLSEIEAKAKASEIKKHAKAPLKDATAVNSSRKKTVSLVSEILPTITDSGAKTKMNRNKQELPKEHWIDAACVGDIPNLTFKTNQPLIVKCNGHGSRQDVNVNKFGFPVGWRDKQGSSFFGFKSGDIAIVKIPYLEWSYIPKHKPTKKQPNRVIWEQTNKKLTSNKKSGTYFGVVGCRATGSFNVATADGRIEGINYRYFKKVHMSDGYRYSFKATKVA